MKNGGLDQRGGREGGGKGPVVDVRGGRGVDPGGLGNGVREERGTELPGSWLE